MKYGLWVTLLLFGCGSYAQALNKPGGEQVLSSLLAASDQDLSKEPLCNMQSISLPSKPYTLRDHLAAILATSYESHNITGIQISCSPSKSEVSGGALIDIWDCQLIANEVSPSGEIISASTVAFGLNQVDFDYVPHSLRCF